jgi:hypothetical protein
MSVNKEIQINERKEVKIQLNFLSYADKSNMFII